MPEIKPDESGDEPDTIKVDYIKSNFFRVVHADGLFGGATPSGLIHMDVWSERQPIPQQSTFPLETVTTDTHGVAGRLGEEIRALRKAREGLVREVEVGVVMSVELAKQMVEWLQDKIKNIDSLQSEIARTKKGGQDAP